MPDNARARVNEQRCKLRRAGGGRLTAGRTGLTRRYQLFHVASTHDTVAELSHRFGNVTRHRVPGSH